MEYDKAFPELRCDVDETSALAKIKKMNKLL